MIIFVLITSIVLQFTAAILALRLIRITGWRLSWVAISCALTLMGVRRSITLIRQLVEEVTIAPDPAAELVALVISVLMVVGLFLIAPIFQSLRTSEERVRRANRALKAISQCNQTIIRATSIPEILEQVCRVIVQIAGYRLAWIGIAEQDEHKTVRPVAQWGFEDGYLETVGITWADTERGWGPTGMAIRTGETCVTRHILTEPDFEPWREQALKRGYQSSISLPLFINDEVFGALNIYSSEPNAFDADETDLLQEMASDLSYGIGALRTREAYADSMREVQHLKEFNEEILQNLITGIVVQDADQTIEYANPAAARMLEYQLEELSGMHWMAVIPEDQYEIVHQTYQRRKKGYADQYELDLLPRNGGRVPVLVSSRPRFINGRFAGFFVAFTNISKRKQAEQELAESQRTLSTLLSNLPGMAYRCRYDSLWTMEFVSEGASELTGYSPSDLILNHKVAYGNLILPEDRDHVWERVQAAIEKQESYRMIYRIETANKEIRWVWEQGRGIFDVKGELTALEGFITDISERIRAEEEVRKRYLESETLNEIITAASAVMDLEALANITLDRTLEVLGIESGAVWIEGFCICKGLRPVENEDLIARFKESGLYVNEPLVVEHWSEIPPGDRLSVMAPVMEEYGIRASLFVPIREGKELAGGLRLDVAKSRRWQEHEIAFSKAVARQVGATVGKLTLLKDNIRQAQQLQRIMDTVQEGIVAMNAEQYITLANPVGQTYLESLVEDIQGGPLTSLGGHPIAEILAGNGGGLPYEIILEDPAPQIFEVYANPSSQDEKGEWTLIIRNVTERRRAERRVELQERLAAVGQLAAGIAHDFNNIIGAIILYCETLLKGNDLSDKNKERVKTIHGQANRATSLVQQILDFSRHTVINPHPVDLVVVLNEFYKLISRTLPENIELKQVDTDEKFVIRADPARLEQVLMNLSINARDAMPEGGELRFKLNRLTIQEGKPPPFRDMTPGKWIKLEVVDSGKGISPQYLSHVFEPFFTTKKPGEGTGLGLAQVYGIVKQHGGYIDVKSRMGSGTRFMIYFPALDMPGIPLSRLEEVDLRKGAGEKILVVEDDDAIREAIEEILGDLNYNVITAENGEVALEIFKKESHSIDLVISDLVMPSMGGRELFLAAQEVDPKVRFMMMSGYPLGNGMRELFDKQAIPWIQKPVNMHELERNIQEALKE
jgi:PAS domain S-box-containing protein